MMEQHITVIRCSQKIMRSVLVLLLGILLVGLPRPPMLRAQQTTPANESNGNDHSGNHDGSRALTQAFHTSVETRPGTITKQKFTPEESSLVPDAQIKVYQSSSSVVIPATVVQREVFLEVFLAAEGGKTHESLLMTKERPKKMNLSLIMAGFKPENNPAETGPQYLGDPTLPRGDTVIPFVEWQLDNGKWVRFRGEDLIYNIEEDMVMRNVGFSFAGSYFISENAPNRKQKNVFAASRIKSLMTLFHDPSAILDVPVPQGGTDGLYQPRTNVLPPKGTNVRLILKAPDENEQDEVSRNITASKQAWADRKERLRKKQERKQNEN